MAKLGKRKKIKGKEEKMDKVLVIGKGAKVGNSSHTAENIWNQRKLLSINTLSPCRRQGNLEMFCFGEDRGPFPNTA